MTKNDRSTGCEVVVDARREAARARARLAEAAVRYADAPIADETAAAPDVPRRNRPKPGEFVADAAQTRSPKQLRVWLLRLVVRLEPLAFEERHRRALTDRRVTVVQGADDMGSVTGEVLAADAAAIDGMLAAAARSLGADDPYTEQQRRSDLFADLLLGRLAFDDNPNDSDDPDSDETDSDETAPAGAENLEWLEVEIIDPDTGNCLAPSCNAWLPTGSSRSGNQSTRSQPAR